MSCPTNAPINLPSAVNQPCSSKCNFEYNYRLSRCSVTNKTTYLVAGDNQGSKIKKAADIGVNIINEEQLSELIKNG